MELIAPMELAIGLASELLTPRAYGRSWLGRALIEPIAVGLACRAATKLETSSELGFTGAGFDAEPRAAAGPDVLLADLDAIYS
jgi:hypothetical protein